MAKDRRERILKGLIENRSLLLRVIHSANDLQFSLSALTWFLEEWSPDDQFTRIQFRKLRCFESAMVIAFMRPFAPSRKGTVLKRKTIGVSFSDEEASLFEKVEDVRNRFIAHADEDEMNFRVDQFELDSVKGISIPNITYDDGLHFSGDELRVFGNLLRRLIHGISKTIWDLTQAYPEEMKFYKQPKIWDDQAGGHPPPTRAEST